MKCIDCQKQMEQYLDRQIGFEEIMEIDTHLLACPDCRSLLQVLKEEAEVIKQVITVAPLPDNFAESILSQIEPYAAHADAATKEPVAKANRSKKPWRAAALSAAAVFFVLISAGMYVSPTFAAYISSFISRIGGELGLKKAAEQGFSTQINASVTDQGITFRVKDILADPTRLVVSYMLEDENGKMLDDLFIPHYGENKIYVTDKAGNQIASSESFRRGVNYADFMFNLSNPPDELIVHFDIREFGSKEPKQVNWKLSVPVDMQKSIAATKSVPIGATYLSPQGIAFELKQVTYAPSATMIDIVTEKTAEEKERVKKMAAAITGRTDEEALSDFQHYRFEYRIVNKQGATVASSEYDPGEKSRTIFFTQNFDQAETKDTWHGAFVPSDEPEELTFVLDAVEVLEPADFSITFDPHTVKEKPVTKKYEEQGETYTIKNAAKKIDPQTKAEVWVIELEGAGKKMEFEKWTIQDESGKRYETEIDYPNAVVKGDPSGAGEERLVEPIMVKGVKGNPKLLTISKQTNKKRYTNVDWQVPIPYVK